MPAGLWLNDKDSTHDCGVGVGARHEFNLVANKAWYLSWEEGRGHAYTPRSFKYVHQIGVGAEAIGNFFSVKKKN